MAEPMPERAYRPRTLHTLFAVSSILLLVAFLAMLEKDYDREWKHWQREFHEMEAAGVKAELAADTSPEKQAQLDTLRRQLATSESDLESKGQRVAAAETDLQDAKSKFWRAERAWKDEHALFDSRRWHFEEDRHLHPEAPHDDKELQAVEDRLEQLRLAKEEAEQHRDEAAARLEALVGDHEAIVKKIAQAQSAIERVRKRLHSFDENDEVYRFRNAPVVDFFSPTIKVEKIVVEGLKDDLHFAQSRRVDMCITCHVPIARNDYAGADHANPLKAHPRLDLYVSSASPHPMERFGCTVCHMGNGQATRFQVAAHTPRDEAEKQRWEKEYDWHEIHHWDKPMYTPEHTYASCWKCHPNAAELPGGERMLAAKQLVTDTGCFGCHKIEGFEGLRNPGPDLTHLAQKTRKEWIRGWIRNPRVFRPTTRMPRFFGLANADPAVREETEIAAIADYLWAKSAPDDLAPLPAGGDPARGKHLFEWVGCMGCHQAKGSPETGITHGPDLSAIGSKATPAWLYNWIRDPKGLFPKTRMPNLRLSQEQAADLVAYLMTLRDPEALAPATAQPDPAVRDEMIVDDLRSQLTKEQAEAKLATMNGEERNLFLGEKMILRRGCTGCHTVPGLEDAQRIGTELTQEGSKLVQRMVFGYTGIDETLAAWFAQKMRAPRSFDIGMVKAPLDKLRMPNFGFTDGEVDLLVMFLQGLVSEKIPSDMREHMDEGEQAYHDGRRLITELNCVGCHRLTLDTVTFEKNGQRATIHGTVLPEKNPAKPDKYLRVQLWEDEPAFATVYSRPKPRAGKTLRIPRGDLVATASGEEYEHGWGDVLFERVIHPAKVAEGMPRLETRPFAPPVLFREGYKIQPQWVYGFLQDVIPLRPWLETQMPTFGLNRDRASLLARYFVEAHNRHEKARKEDLAKIEGGEEVRTQVLDWPFPILPETQKTYFPRKESSHPGYVADARKIFGGLQCTSCHWKGREAPKASITSQGPDLTLAKHRLRPAWIREWLLNPAAMQPGTQMPSFFDPEMQQYQDFFAGTYQEQIGALKDALFLLPDPEVISLATAANSPTGASPKDSASRAGGAGGTR